MATQTSINFDVSSPGVGGSDVTIGAPFTLDGVTIDFNCSLPNIVTILVANSTASLDLASSRTAFMSRFSCSNEVNNAK